jgi:hypothetical protein
MANALNENRPGALHAHPDTNDKVHAVISYLAVLPVCRVFSLLETGRRVVDRTRGHRTLRPYSGIDVLRYLLDTFSIYAFRPFHPFYCILRFFCFTPETNYDLLARELRTSSPARPRKLRRLPLRHAKLRAHLLRRRTYPIK